MDFPNFTVLIAAAGLTSGFGLCWLLMRNRSPASAPPAGPAAAQPGELAQARDRIRQLEEECQAAVKRYGDLKHQTARARELPDLRLRNPAAPPELTAQLGSLQAQLSALQAQEIASRADAARAHSDALAEQAQAKEYFRMLEKNQQQATAQAQALTLEADRLRGALAQAVRQAAQIPGLEARLAALQQPAPVTQLPALEAQVAALRTLEKAIKKEFKLLAEVQRNVILTSATRHEFIDSPEARAGAGPAPA